MGEQMHLFSLSIQKGRKTVLDIIFSAVLIIASIYLFLLIGIEAPASTATELGAAFWPRIILVLMLILSVVNLLNAVKKMKAEGGHVMDGINLAEFFRSRLFVGMVIIVIMALLLPAIGFIPTCILFLVVYGILLGTDNKGKLALFAVLITVCLYVLFQGALDIMLPRGVGPFRDFALALETMMPL